MREAETKGDRSIDHDRDAKRRKTSRYTYFSDCKSLYITQKIYKIVAKN